MTPERWREIERLYHAALAHPVGARAAFLAEACPDADTRREVESLLTQMTNEALRTGGALMIGASPDDTEGKVHDTTDSSLVGSRLGVYAIGERLGAGGMGEVYRAHDTRLGRQVAIKVLPDAFTRDADRLARFEREARVLAALNHANIATIHGLEESRSPRGPALPILALVMELVEGDTLAARISRRPIPIAETCQIATQIAEALEVAHEKGIVHRDLKPANIKIRPDGTVKVLDFGLAKLTGAPGAAPDTPLSGTGVGDTREGAIVGTAAYMSPEQATGQPVDKRADIWSFGCLLYEMLTGQRAFGAEDAAETLAAVLRGEPDLRRLPDDVSPSLRGFLARCLTKDPKQRLHDIADMRLALEGGFESRDAGWRGSARQTTPLWKRVAPFAATALVTTAVVIAAIATWPTAPRPVTRLVLDQAGRALDLLNNTPALALSPDATHVVYRERRDGVDRLVSRALDGVESVPLSGGNSGFAPFFSPDGAWVAFHDLNDGMIKRVAVSGGPPQAIASAGRADLRGASWAPDDTIVFATEAPSGLWRVRSGGTPDPLTTLDAARGEINHVWPEVLPDGRAVLFTIQHDLVDRETDEIAVRDLGTGAQRILIEGGAYPKYVASGHLLYGLNGTLLAAPFDREVLSLTGDPVGMEVGVATTLEGGMELAAANGTLVYATGITAVVHADRQLGSVDREGRWEALPIPTGRYAHPRVSSDGRYLAFQRELGGVTNVWLYDLSGTAAPRQLTQIGNNRYPVWSRDGRHVVFQSDREGDLAIWWQRTDGTGSAERLTTPARGTAHVPEDWSPTEDRLSYAVVADDAMELWLWQAADRTSARVDGVAAAFLFYSTFSPDGRWLAFTERHADQTVRTFVRAVPPAAGRYPLGTGAELIHHPLWAPTGDTLFYFRAASPLVAAPFTAEPTPAFGPAVPLPGNGLPINVRPGLPRNHDITPDGGRIIAVFNAEELQRGRPVEPRIVVVQHWFEELRQRAR